MGVKQDKSKNKKKIVLVGTYAGDQLKDWPAFYPYPLAAGDKVDAEGCKRVNEIWLFKGTKEARYFAAEFVGVKTRAELKALGYPAKGRGHGDGSYLLFNDAFIRVVNAPGRGCRERIYREFPCMEPPMSIC